MIHVHIVIWITLLHARFFLFFLVLFFWAGVFGFGLLVFCILYALTLMINLLSIPFFSFFFFFFWYPVFVWYVILHFCIKIIYFIHVYLQRSDDLHIGNTKNWKVVFLYNFLFQHLHVLSTKVANQKLDASFVIWLFRCIYTNKFLLKISDINQI